MSIKEEQEERREKRGEITAQKLGATRAIKIPEKNENPLEKNNNNNKKKTTFICVIFLKKKEGKERKGRCFGAVGTD